MKVTVINNNGNIRVHRKGCRDVAKESRSAESTWTLEISEGREVGEVVVDDLNDSFGWSPEDEEPAPWVLDRDITILPCCNGH